MLKTVANFDRIGEENAFAVLARANALATQGRDIINLGIGQRFKVSVSPDEVMIMPGGKPTMFMSILMFGEPGAEIMYPDPGFPIYRSMIEYTGARPIPVPIREENNFAF